VSSGSQNRQVELISPWARLCLLLAAVPLVVCLFAGSVAGDTDEVTEATAKELFSSAFEKGVGARERIAILKELVSDYGKSKWADDALWAISELASRSKNSRVALKYKLTLVKDYPGCRIEKETEGLALYRKSRLPSMLRVIESTGHHVVKRGRRYHYYNPLPMVMNQDIAVVYLRRRQEQSALKYYKAALKAAPPGGILREMLSKKVKRLDAKVADKKKSKSLKKEDDSRSEKLTSAKSGEK